MLQLALQKISAEVGAADKKQRFVPVVGGFLMNHVRQHPEHAQLILVEGKTIAGSLDAMKAEAQKNAVNGCGMLTDEEGFNVVLRYYGATVEVKAAVPPVAAVAKPTNFSGSLDDLL